MDILKMMYSLPVGLMEFVTDEKGNTTIGIVTPEVIRILGHTKFLGKMDSLSPSIENNKALEELTKELEKDNVTLVITGDGKSDYLFFVDKSNLISKELT